MAQALIRCQYCQASYVREEDLNAHTDLHFMPNGQCSSCIGVYPNLIQHKQETHDTICDLCDCTVAKDELANHLALQHQFETVWNRTDSLQKIPGKKEGGGSGEQQTAVTVESVATPVLTSIAPSTVSNNSSGIKCKACSLVFTSEKLYEKHYTANHDFPCKFCDKKMDKDVYGGHLRAHLANNRKKTEKSGSQKNSN